MATGEGEVFLARIDGPAWCGRYPWSEWRPASDGGLAASGGGVLRGVLVATGAGSSWEGDPYAPGSRLIDGLLIVDGSPAPAGMVVSAARSGGVPVVLTLLAEGSPPPPRSWRDRPPLL